MAGVEGEITWSLEGRVSVHGSHFPRLKGANFDFARGEKTSYVGPKSRCGLSFLEAFFRDFVFGGLIRRKLIIGIGPFISFDGSSSATADLWATSPGVLQGAAVVSANTKQWRTGLMRIGHEWGDPKGGSGPAGGEGRTSTYSTGRCARGRATGRTRG